MSETQTGDDVIEQDKGEQDRRNWIKAELRVDVPGRDRSGAFLGKARTPKPQWQDGTTPKDDAPKGPSVGTERGEGAFNKRLSESMDTIELARSLPPATEKARLAKESMETRLSDMTDAAKAKNFTQAGAALDDALKSAQSVSDERVAAKKLFDEAFYPLHEKLTASVDKTRGLTGIDGAVASAEKTAEDRAAEAEKAVEQDDYAVANEKLKAFTTDMSTLTTAYTDAGNLLDEALTKALAKLKRGKQGLKGTELTTEAATAKKVQEAVAKAQLDANSAASPDARLAGLAAARDKAAEATKAAQNALTEKFNKGSADGLTEIRKGAKAAVDALANGTDKTALIERLAEWDKQKIECDKEADPAKKKTALRTLDANVRAIMEDAEKIELAAQKAAALKPVNDAAPGDKLTALGVAATSAIGALTDGETKTDLLKQLGEWNSAKGKNDIQTNVNKKTQFAVVLDTYIRRVIDEAIAAKAEEKRQEVFKAALEKRFGLTITLPAGMTNSHFDQFYDMMDRLPVQQSSQDSLKILNYRPGSKGASYNEGLARVSMGTFGSAETWEYQDPGNPQTKLPMNAFSINSLHEIGHAVDAKYRVMAKNMQNAGCGKWEIETEDKVVAALLKDLKASAGTALKASDNALKALLRTALTKGAVQDPNTKAVSVTETQDSEKPGTMDPTEWGFVKAQLNKAVKIRSNNWPWGKGSTVTLDSRAYHESYDGEWVSYDPNARTGTEVRDYQFRAPAEWFAELYAYTWFKKTKPPASVDKTAAKYMYSAKA